ncbi:MAG: hypothetical protein ACI9D5_001090 [Candidatus Endobugula sp.]|jgi:hypothetical protein
MRYFIPTIQVEKKTVTLLLLTKIKKCLRTPLLIMSALLSTACITQVSASAASPLENYNVNNDYTSLYLNHANLTRADIEIETGTESIDSQKGYTFKQFGDIRFTQSSLEVGLQVKLLDIKKSCETAYQLVNSLQDQGGAIVWEVARLKSEGELVLPIDIFGYMDKQNYHSGLMRLNHSALQYIIIDVTPVNHQTIHGPSRADLKNIMAHEAIHVVLPHRRLLHDFENGRALTELFTAYYTNQIRHERDMPLRISYGDPLTAVFDKVVSHALTTGEITPEDLIANLQLRLANIKINSLYEPKSINEYGISKKLLAIFNAHDLLKKKI